MPQLTLEITRGLCPDVPMGSLLASLHDAFVRVGRVPISNCKSRVVERATTLVGDGTGSGSFAHLEAAWLGGRPEATTTALGRALLDALKVGFRSAVENDDLQITVEVRSIPPTTYSKHPEGTLPTP